MLAILLLAAGRASRMQGADKMLQPVAGQPLIAEMAHRALQTGCPVHVCLPPDRPARAAALCDLNIHHITVQDANQGMAHSIRAGIAALPSDTSAAMILPADMPELTAADLIKMAAAYSAQDNQTILRATASDGRPGHPVIFPAAYFDQLKTISGDIGARALLKQHHANVSLIALPDAHALTDLDTPQAWADWHAAQATRP